MASMTGNAALRAVAAIVVLGKGAMGSPMHVAKMCRGKLCNDAMFPILDYDLEEEKCICRQPPCWDENGTTHACDSPEFPFLRYRYSEEGELLCDCSARPFFGSIYIARDLCPGKECLDDAFPQLDYDNETSKCICREHPCTDVNGERHICPDMRFPVLRYTEEEPEEEGEEPEAVCDCIPRLELKLREEIKLREDL